LIEKWKNSKKGGAKLIQKFKENRSFVEEFSNSLERIFIKSLLMNQQKEEL
jgi:hypothetical protein